MLGPVIVLGLVVAALPAAGGTYRWIDKNGQVVYSDRPPQPDEAAPEGTTPPAPRAAAPAAPRRPVHQAASELIELCGLKDQVKAVALQARRHVQDNLGHLEPRDVKNVEAITARTLDPERLVRAIVDEFSQLIDDTKIADVRTWYRSPLGRKITELEVRASSEDRQRQLAAFVAEWRVKPPAAARVAMIQRLDAASGTTELSVDMVVGITQAIVRVADPYLPPERRLKAGQLEAQARQIRLATLERFRQGNTVALLHLFRDVPDGELTSYIRFLETEAGAWLGGAVRRSMVEALAGAVAGTVTDLVRVVPPQRWGGPGAFKKPPLPPAEGKL
jgi:hypothetical protein